jgi:hypothetical protein
VQRLFGGVKVAEQTDQGGEQHPGIGMGPGQKDGPVQGGDGLARACGFGDTRAGPL